MLDVAIFMIRVYFSSTCAHIKFKHFSLQSTEHLLLATYHHAINMHLGYFIVGRIQ